MLGSVIKSYSAEMTDKPGKPRATVVVPVRNRPELLSTALRALTARDLSRDDLEVVVVNDGSDEDIASVVSAYAGSSVQRPTIRLVNLRPSGPAAARNAGIRESKAPVVIFVDSDVEVDPDCILNLLHALDTHPNWVGAEAKLVPKGGEDGVLWDAPAAEHGGRYHTAAIAYRRNALNSVGGFDETFKLPACEDVELAVRLLRIGPIGFTDRAIAYHPRRRVRASTHWKWGRHWRYEMILAVRYGIISFPGRSAGRFPRLRVALAALVNLPTGRLLTALSAFPTSPRAAASALAFSVIDVVRGAGALPVILFARVPPRRNYLSCEHPAPKGRAP